MNQGCDAGVDQGVEGVVVEHGAQVEPNPMRLHGNSPSKKLMI
jgi:hypothetical protein